VTKIGDAYTREKYLTRIYAKPLYKELNTIFTEVQLYLQLSNIYKIYTTKYTKQESKGILTSFRRVN